MHEASIMPLLDHFEGSLSHTRRWHGFFVGWVSSLSDSINAARLPPRYFAEPAILIGGRAREDAESVTPSTSALPPNWVMPAEFPDTFEVHVLEDDGGIRLVAAIELVSPSNKDRPESRRAFAAKCANFLCQGIPFIVIDVVTNRRANLHNETMELLHNTDCLLPVESHLYATAYRPVRRQSREEIDAWHQSIELDKPLPKLPLFLDVDIVLELDFESSYQETCQRLRVTKPE